MADMEEKVAGVISAGVHPWTIMSKGIDATRQRTYCPFCQVQLVEWGDHSKTCEARLPVARAALEACCFEELVTALRAAQTDLADTLEASLDCACQHDADGAIIRNEMDEDSRPMISNMERLLARIDDVLAKVEAGHA